MQVLVRRIGLTLLALLLAVARDPIQQKLIEFQPAQLDRSEPYDAYKVFDHWPDGTPRTIFAILFADSEHNTALYAFRVDRNKALHKLAEYGRGDARRIALRDLTGDSVPEVLLTDNPGNRSAPVELLKWDGKTFHKIGETSDHADYTDLDHDGVVEVVDYDDSSKNSCGTWLMRPYIQKLRHGKFNYIDRKTLAGLLILTKNADEPEYTTGVIALPDNFSRTCHFHIVNGTSGGRNRLSSIAIRARGVTLPVHISARDEYSDAVVRLPSRCMTVRIELYGPATAVAAIMIDTSKIAKP